MARADRRQALLDALDESLGLFGETVKGIIYYYLEAKYGVRRTELYLPENLAKLADLISEIFGPASGVLGGFILNKLCSTLGINRSKLPRKFKDALIHLCRSFIGEVS